MSATIALSTFSALFVAPIISLGKTFNQQRYYLIAGTSLAVFTAALTINLTLTKKTFNVNGASSKKKWVIKPDIDY
jgi:hypothetical protein